MGVAADPPLPYSARRPGRRSRCSRRSFQLPKLCAAPPISFHFLLRDPVRVGNLASCSYPDVGAAHDGVTLLMPATATRSGDICRFLCELDVRRTLVADALAGSTIRFTSTTPNIGHFP
jgi:hypothetical protein